MGVPSILAIDLGTSAVKVALVALDGRVLALRTQEYPLSLLPGGGAEVAEQLTDRAGARLVHLLRAAVARRGAAKLRLGGLARPDRRHGRAEQVIASCMVTREPSRRL